MRAPRRPRRVEFFPVPQPPDWATIHAAIAGRWNIMLCWEARAGHWRCDFIQPGRIASGTGSRIGLAIAEAWAATDESAPRPDL